jgi:hypothetical protein
MCIDLEQKSHVYVAIINVKSRLYCILKIIKCPLKGEIFAVVDIVFQF